MESAILLVRNLRLSCRHRELRFRGQHCGKAFAPSIRSLSLFHHAQDWRLAGAAAHLAHPLHRAAARLWRLAARPAKRRREEARRVELRRRGRRRASVRWRRQRWRRPRRTMKRRMWRRRRQGRANRRQRSLRRRDYVQSSECFVQKHLTTELSYPDTTQNHPDLLILTLSPFPPSRLTANL